MLPASTEAKIDAVFETLAREQIRAVEVAADPFLDNHRNKLIALAARYSVAAMYHFRTSRGRRLMSYGIDLTVMKPTKFELIINAKTAKALGLSIPPQLLALADEVID
jgi:putative ABC transport system substrate-binding protein